MCGHSIMVFGSDDNPRSDARFGRPSSYGGMAVVGTTGSILSYLAAAISSVPAFGLHKPQIGLQAQGRSVIFMYN